MKKYLISKEDREYLEKHNSMDRRTGKSTAIALETIAKSIRNPNKIIRIEDHYNTRMSNKYLMRTIMDMVNNLDLQGFEFNFSNITISFNLYES